MNSLSTCVGSRYLSLVLLIISLNSCEVNEPGVFPDYTGQTDIITDIDGNHYKTIGIGTQIWMQENLEVTHLANGEKIILLESNLDWRNKNLNTGAYCWYDDDSVNNRSIYGGLYNFYAFKTGLLCPTGWHVPSQNDWNTLVDFLGGKDVAGGKLIDFESKYWIDPIHYVDNNFKFLALPGGSRHPETAEFQGKGIWACWWANRTSKEDDSKAPVIVIGKDEIALNENYIYKNGGASIRCVKN
jgi:uncharacterized protein (TIGR02145 family)